MTTIPVLILGTTYHLKFGTHEELELTTEVDGDCNYYSKVIRVRSDLFFGSDDKTDEELLIARREVLAHEITHAFFHEAGLDGYGTDEVLVDWIALMLSRLTESVEKAFSELLDKG